MNHKDAENAYASPLIERCAEETSSQNASSATMPCEWVYSLLVGASLMLLVYQMSPLTLLGELIRESVPPADSVLNDSEERIWGEYYWWLVDFPMLFWVISGLVGIAGGFTSIYRKYRLSVIVMCCVIVVCSFLGLTIAGREFADIF